MFGRNAKRLRLQVAELQKTVDDLQKTLEVNELKRLRGIEKRYNETMSYLSNVKLKVKAVKYSEQDQTIFITYDAPTVVLNVDDEGNIDTNRIFKSINMLDLISIDDMQMISKELNKIKQNH